MQRDADPRDNEITLPGLAVVPSRFRIDERTRRIGLAGIARVRAQLAEQEARRLEQEQQRNAQRPVTVRAPHPRAFERAA